VSTVLLGLWVCFMMQSSRTCWGQTCQQVAGSSGA
jgi:hypothetical protein